MNKLAIYAPTLRAVVGLVCEGSDGFPELARYAPVYGDDLVVVTLTEAARRKRCDLSAAFASSFARYPH